MSSWLFRLSGEVMEGLTSFEEVFEVVVKATQKLGKIAKVGKKRPYPFAVEIEVPKKYRKLAIKK